MLRVEIASNKENVKMNSGYLYSLIIGVFIHSIGERGTLPARNHDARSGHGEPPVRDAVFTGKSSPHTESLKLWR
jgi:hypothetical protein